MVNVKILQHNGVVYLRREDVFQYIRAYAANEQPDVRKRLEMAAMNIMSANIINVETV